MARSGQDSGDAGRDGPESSASKDPFPGLASLAGMGVQFLAAILLFMFAGKWLDSRLGTSPWLLILGVFSAAGASTYAMYRRVFPREGPRPPGPGEPLR